MAAQGLQYQVVEDDMWTMIDFEGGQGQLTDDAKPVVAAGDLENTGDNAPIQQALPDEAADAAGFVEDIDIFGNHVPFDMTDLEIIWNDLGIQQDPPQDAPPILAAPNLGNAGNMLAASQAYVDTRPVAAGQQQIYPGGYATVNGFANLGNTGNVAQARPAYPNANNAAAGFANFENAGNVAGANPLYPNNGWNLAGDALVSPYPAPPAAAATAVYGGIGMGNPGAQGQYRQPLRHDLSFLTMLQDPTARLVDHSRPVPLPPLAPVLRREPTEREKKRAAKAAEREAKQVNKRRRT